MKYLGHDSDFSRTNTVIGVLLVNLGSPDRPVCPGLRKYLAEFLMDPRVIEIPKLLRLLLVRGIIVNFRSHKSAANYREIWTEEGSPLLINSTNLGIKTSEILASRKQKYRVEVAMRYGNPSVAEKITKMHNEGIRRLIVIPLYPQYSGSTNGSTFDAIAKALCKQRWVPETHFVSDYHQRPGYIQAIGKSIKRHWQKHGRKQKLLMSFHGVPQKFIKNGDPYQSQCTNTAQSIAEYLDLQPSDWMLVFQSRLGAQQWLQPYCDQTLKSLPAEGISSVDIVCPGFSADCLETLEEIDVENRNYFLQAGGKSYSYIKCLNDSDDHAQLMAEIIGETIR
jgi:ferrochelatase